MEKRFFRKDGTVSWVQVTRSLLRDDFSNTPLYFIVHIEDINERIQDREKISYLAFHDKLTGLPNRHYLQELLIKIMATAKRYKQVFAIMFLDLDKFKQINDTLGHDAGDELLKEITFRLNKITRSNEIIARTGGDEFIIVLTDIPSPQDAAIVADRILKIINQPLTIRNQPLQIAASIGIVTYPANGEDITELMKNADMAMYQAKEMGGNQYHFY